MIRTPDQRLRVFVSSTLEELAAERTAAREAIERLRLTPVLFELGARPHPPQELYRSYLEQSDVFIGIYGDRYGWVAPGMDISGLEDEFRLGAKLPRLLYVKAPAPGRDPRLEALIAEVMDSGDVTFKLFSEASELGGLIEDDLALLLSEHFAQAPGRIRTFVPSPVDRFVGRSVELESLEAMLENPAARLVTVTGPGGVGKTRLALEAARRASPKFAAGAHFVALSAITDPELVSTAIYESLGAPRGASSPATALVEALRDEELLLVVDNFERVLPAARELSVLLEHCPRLKLLATSQAVLRLRGEREVRLDPLKEEDAIALFADRAEAASHSFQLDEHGATVGELCDRLDRVPLALELAAVQVRLLPPNAILERLHASPGWMSASGADVPDRQRTLGAVMDWSLGLLDEDERRLCLLAAVFPGGFTLEALNSVAGDDVLALLGRLVESSLVRVGEVDGEPRYSMLESIRVHALSRLDEEGGLEDAREAHARFFGELIEQAGSELRRGEHAPTFARLDREYDNVRGALDWWLQREGEPVVTAGWALLPYWVFRERLVEGLRWLADARGREVGEPVRARAFVGEAVLALFLSDYPRAAQSLAEASTTVDAEDQEIRAVIDFVMGTLETTQGAEHGVALLEGARDLFTALDNRWGVTLSTLGLVWALVAAERDAPLELYESTVEAAGALGIEAETLALGALGRRLTLRGDISEAKKTLGEALVRTVSLRAVVGTALYVDLLGDVAAREGEDALAARLSAASEAFFASAGAEVPAMVGRRAERLSGLRDRLGRDAFEVEWAAGLALPLEDAVAAARAFAES